MSKCTCFNQLPKGKTLQERLPKCTCHCKSNTRLCVEENGRKFILVIDKWEKVEKVKVDGSLIHEQQTEKCDYFFYYSPDLMKKERQALFVELKGKNITKAISQIITTLQRFLSEGLMYNVTDKKGFVVSSRFPQTDRTIEKLKEDMIKKHHCPVLVKNNILEYKP